MKRNSRRYEPVVQQTAWRRWRVIEWTELCPKRIHATTLQEFVLEVWGFIFAHNYGQLARIL